VWLRDTYDVDAACIRDLGMRTAEDESVFLAAREANACIMTKDRDFVELSQRLGPPPPVIWLTCGNTSNARMREILTISWPTAVDLVEHGEPLIEITDAPKTSG